MTKSYTITAVYKNYVYCEVEANNEQEAKELALGQNNWQLFDDEEEYKKPTIKGIEENE